MKSEDFQNLVLSNIKMVMGRLKYFEIFSVSLVLGQLNGGAKLEELLALSSPPARQRTIRTKRPIQKIKYRLERRKPVSSRKTSRQLDISRTSIRRILRNDLGLRANKVQNEPLLPKEHKEKRVKSANWIPTNFRKENTLKILFSDEKMFDIDGIYICQNDRK